MGLTNDPTCKSLILLVSGYNLKVRGSNPLPATNSLIEKFFTLQFGSNLQKLRFFLTILNFTPKFHRPYLLVKASSDITQVLLALQPCLLKRSLRTMAFDLYLIELLLLTGAYALGRQFTMPLRQG